MLGKGAKIAVTIFPTPNCRSQAESAQGCERIGREEIVQHHDLWLVLCPKTIHFSRVWNVNGGSGQTLRRLDVAGQAERRVGHAYAARGEPGLLFGIVL